MITQTNKPLFICTIIGAIERITSGSFMYSCNALNNASVGYLTLIEFDWLIYRYQDLNYKNGEMPFWWNKSNSEDPSYKLRRINALNTLLVYIEGLNP